MRFMHASQHSRRSVSTGMQGPDSTPSISLAHDSRRNSSDSQSRFPGQQSLQRRKGLRVDVEAKTPGLSTGDPRIRPAPGIPEASPAAQPSQPLVHIPSGLRTGEHPRGKIRRRLAPLHGADVRVARHAAE